MRVIKNIIFLMFNIEYVISDEVILKNNEDVHTVFNIEKSSNSLIISFNGKKFQYKNVIGVEGQVYKDFLIFNNQPALWYSNTTSKNTYNITLNRAICGLNEKLTTHYRDVIYLFFK